MYKVLDVREIVTISDGSTSSGVYGGSGSFAVNSKQYIIVIAEDENQNRKRFAFYSGYRSEFLGDPIYYGYQGDYKLLIPGDMFEIENAEANGTWPKVKLIKEN